MLITTAIPENSSSKDISTVNKLSALTTITSAYEVSHQESKDAIHSLLLKVESYNSSDLEEKKDFITNEMRVKAEKTTRVTSPVSEKLDDPDVKELKHVCPICTKELPSQHEFTLHIRSHNDIKNSSSPVKAFQCKICGKVLSSSSSLDRHVLVHSGERPFTCKICGGTFTTNGNMHRHMRTHGQSAYYETEDILLSPRKLFKRKSVSDSECTPTKKEFQKYEESSPVCHEGESYEDRTEDSQDFLAEDHDEKSVDGELKQTTESVHPDDSNLSSKLTSKDLADINSIIYVSTTGNIFPDLKEYNSNPTSDNSAKSQNYLASPQSTEMSSYLEYGDDEEDTMQDPLSAQIREMKMKGEFPCRLCSMIFPNLRALKGHNRVHLQSSPYECNMCSYNSHDKNTLIRHMRIHNGERPYECKICHYAFTTKANCERHLKNRHGKITRDEIRDSLQHHPSETDVSAPGDGCKICKVDFPASKLLSEHMRTQHGDLTAKPVRCKVCKHYFPSKQHVLRHALKQHPNVGKDVFVLDQSDDDEQDSSSVNNYSSVEIPLSTMSRTMSEEDTGYVSAWRSTLFSSMQSEPLDLSCKDRPLDLSFKADTSSDLKSTPISQIYSSQSLPFPGVSPIFPSLLFPPDRKPPPVFLPHLNIPNGYPVMSGDEAEGNESSRDSKYDKANNPLSLITPRLPYAFHSQWSTLGASADSNVDSNLLSGTSPKNQFLKCVVQSDNTAAYNNSPLSAGSHDSSKENSPENKLDLSSVKVESYEDEKNLKVVIKNGILMKKQKQRRYRTERPFSCEHCAARFTLRSNMERHIKQQHPQFWSQKPRGGRRNPLAPSGQVLDAGNLETKKDSVFIKNEDSSDVVEDSEEKPTNLKVEAEMSNDAESALVIDEEVVDSDKLDGGEDSTKSCEESCIDLASVSKLIDNANTHNFQQYFQSKSLEEDLDGNNSENDRESSADATDSNRETRKKSAYSTAPHRVTCPFCLRKFPWSSSLSRHILTHTGYKPYKCPQCSLLFTTKSNCDRHLQRKHGDNSENSYTMRNVPERPYKCSRCPSSTFSTLNNLKKHQLVRHSTTMRVGSGAEDGDEPGEQDVNLESMSEGEEKSECGLSCNKCSTRFLCPKELASHIEHHHTDLPFKCHLCDESYSDRNHAIDHIKQSHENEYKVLVSKGALEALDETSVEPRVDKEGDSENMDSLRGKFPDYVNRKVSCCFCLRRFWSAEDLRRHMRTHTGEKPFCCSICWRRFTLKHSMIRHKKKHFADSRHDDDAALAVHRGTDSDNESVDSCHSNSLDCNEPSSRTSPGLSDRDSHSEYSSSSTTKHTINPSIVQAKTDGDAVTCDLIGNLLGIKDSALLDEVLISKSANDAAKLLGVDEGQKTPQVPVGTDNS